MLLIGAPFTLVFGTPNRGKNVQGLSSEGKSQGAPLISMFEDLKRVLTRKVRGAS